MRIFWKKAVKSAAASWTPPPNPRLSLAAWGSALDPRVATTACCCSTSSVYST